MSKLCPDRQLLSVYFDGELPSPWKEKMESHIAACVQCTGRLKAYQDIRSGPVGQTPATESVVRAAGERVWQRLESRSGLAAAGRARINRTLWRRRVSIPIPAAAAALVLFAALTVFMALRITGTEETSDMILASEAEVYTPGVIPTADVENVLQYLGGSDNGDIIILRMPESRSFEKYGEPAIIRAADYSRNMPEWRKR